MATGFASFLLISFSVRSPSFLCRHYHGVLFLHRDTTQSILYCQPAGIFHQPLSNCWYQIAVAPN